MLSDPWSDTTADLPMQYGYDFRLDDSRSTHFAFPKLISDSSLYELDMRFHNSPHFLLPLSHTSSFPQVQELSSTSLYPSQYLVKDIFSQQQQQQQQPQQQLPPPNISLSEYSLTPAHDSAQRPQPQYHSSFQQYSATPFPEDLPYTMTSFPSHTTDASSLFSLEQMENESDAFSSDNDLTYSFQSGSELEEEREHEEEEEEEQEAESEDSDEDFVLSPKRSKKPTASARSPARKSKCRTSPASKKISSKQVQSPSEASDDDVEEECGTTLETVGTRGSLPQELLDQVMACLRFRSRSEVLAYMEDKTNLKDYPEVASFTVHLNAKRDKVPLTPFEVDLIYRVCPANRQTFVNKIRPVLFANGYRQTPLYALIKKVRRAEQNVFNQQKSRRRRLGRS